MKRADVLLVERNLAPSRTKAQELIATGQVEYFGRGHWRLVSGASLKLGLGTELRLIDATLLKYVSRSGLKLEKALEHLNLSVAGLTALDMGQSTGGFTDCLLQHGVERVLGIDVGHGQVAERLLKEPRVTVLEGVHGRDLPCNDHFLELHWPKFDLVVMDVSFISMTDLLPAIAQVIRPSGKLLSLVKPQFELDAKSLNKKGVVKDPSHYFLVKDKILGMCGQMGFVVQDYFDSELPGRDGNREFFVYGEYQSESE